MTFFRAFCAMLCALTTQAVCGADGPLVFLGNDHHAPLEYLDHGSPRGYVIELARAVAKGLGRPYVLDLEDWTLAQRQVQEGTADVLVGVAYTLERAGAYDLTDPVSHSQFTFFTRGRPELNQPEDLSGLTVAVVAGGIPQALISTVPRVRIHVVASYEDGFRAVQDGAVQVFAGDRWVGAYLLSSGQWPDVGASTINFATLPMGFAVRKGNTALLQALNDAIRKEKSEGAFRAIERRWEAASVVFLTRDQALLVALGGGGLVLLALVFWVVFLLRQIERRQAAEKELRRLTGAFQQARWGISISDDQGLLVFANPEYARMHGYAVEELLGRSPEILIHPKDREPVQRLLADAKTGQNTASELVRVRRDGSTFPAVLNVTKLEASPGDRLSFVVNVLDITERKRFEKTISDQSAQMRALLGTMPDLVWLKDTDGVYLACNRRFETYLGVPESEILGRTDYFFLEKEVADEARDHDQRVLQEGRPLVHEGLHRFADGHAEYLEVIDTPVYDPKGRVLGILGLARDFTRRKQDFEALKQSQTKFLKVFNASPEAIVIYRRSDQVVIEVNDGFTKVTGFTREEGLGSTATELGFWLSVEDRTRFRTELAKDGSLSGFEVSLRMKSGVVKTFLVNSDPIEIDGQACQLDHYLDITERKRLEGEALELQAQLHSAERMESLGILAGGIAHDMNNVLGAILGMASANATFAPDRATREAFEIIAKAADRGGTVVKSLLGFARQSPAASHSLDFNQLLRDHVPLLDRSVLTRTRVVWDLAEDLLPLVGDETALGNAVVNLIVNAVDAMDDQGVLTLRTWNVGATGIAFQVEDTGSGMGPEVLRKALDPFFTTKAPGKGTGLGLALVYSTVKAHLGQLDIQSEPGQGTRVTLTFPAQPGGTVPAEPPAVPARPQASQRVLLVDDDLLVRTAVEAMVVALGYQVSAVASGEAALETLAGGGDPPDVIILDLTMPGLGGQGTLPRIREWNPRVPVLLCTGLVNQGALDLVALYPRVRLLAKPFGAAELRQALDEVSALGPS